MLKVIGKVESKSNDNKHKSQVINELNKIRKKFKNTLSNPNSFDSKTASTIRVGLEEIDSKFSVILDVFYNSDLLFNDIAWFDQVVDEIKILDNLFFSYLNLLLDIKKTGLFFLSKKKELNIENLFINFDQIKKNLDKIYLLVLDAEKSNSINVAGNDDSVFIKTLKREKNNLNKEIIEKNKRILELEKYINSLGDVDKNKPAAALYNEINGELLMLEKKYRRYFIIAIILTLFIAIGYKPNIGLADNFILVIRSLIPSPLLMFLPEFMNNIVYESIDFKKLDLISIQYVIFKIAILIVGLTLTTYFLRLSNFYQLRQEQAKQTKLELEAYPEYVSGLDKDVANRIREELALKYFGQNLDKSSNEKIGNILQDQITASTEVLKASVEMVKSVKAVKFNSMERNGKTSKDEQSVD